MEVERRKFVNVLLRNSQKKNQVEILEGDSEAKSWKSCGRLHRCVAGMKASRGL